MSQQYDPATVTGDYPRRLAVSRARTWILCATVAMGSVVLSSCSQDDANKPSSTIAPGSPEFVVHTADEYDLIDNATQSVNLATWNQSGPFQVGTGNLNPFMRIQATGQEEGFNTNAKPAPLNADQSWTKALPLNNVPVVRRAGVSYREFIVDANEANSAPNAFFSIDFFNVWLCVGDAAAGYTSRSQFESVPNCKRAYDIGAGKRILATDDLSSGSGKNYDYQILIPEQKFIDAASLIPDFSISTCGYNGFEAPSCGAYIIVDTHMGGKGGDYITGATFEEVSTIKRPWVTVTKTAVPSFKRRYLWQIQKSVNPTDITLFDGQSQTATWTINVTPQSPAFADFEAVVAGTITITNPSPKALTIGSISDAIGDGYATPTLTCPSGTTNVALASGATYVCTYTVPAPNTTPGSHTNTATVTVLSGVEGEDPSVFTGKAQFNFANATPSQEIDKNPNVYDNYNGEGEALKGTASQSPFTYQKTYTCGSTTDYTNVARVDLAAPTTDPTATATLHLRCLTLNVSKTAATAKTRTYQWQINKSATPTSWVLFNGDQGTTQYTISVQPAATPFVDSDIAVSGNITIQNPNSVPVYLQSVSDVLSGAGAPAVTPSCGVSFAAPGYVLAAGASLVCTYSAPLPNNDARTNTANVSAKPTATGTAKAFSSTAVAVNPASATLTEVNKTVNVTDKFCGTTSIGSCDAVAGAVALGTVTAPNSGTFNTNHTFTCAADAGTFNNIARITQTGQTSAATVTVSCRDISVSKTATTKYRRKWTWGVTKTINPTSTNLLLDIDQTYIVGYTVTYTATPAEDNFRASGTVRITNPASAGPAATTTATINSLTDVMTGPITVTLTCPVTFPATLAAGATIDCTYTDVSVPNKTARTNTATAVRQKKSFSSTLAPTNNGTQNYAGNADVTFSATPSEALDQCANVSDSNPGTTVTGNRCATGTTATSFPFTYNKTLKYSTCGTFTVPNTASFATTAGTLGSTSNTATPLTGSASVTINVQVACPEGCTLTQGYWKTHNESFRGGAPIDDNWNKLSAKEATGFFTATAPSYTVLGPNAAPFTWFQVFWTAPKGNAYYNLAHQYMAAKLNYLNGAGQTSAVTSTIASAETFFSTAGNTPDSWTDGSTTKTQLIGWAGILGAYNEGTSPGGPRHCSEDNTSDK